MRIGLMGGTFDPIHLGHLRAAECAREELALERVLFMPAAVPPHRVGPRASPRDRYTMTALATASHPAFACSSLELDRDGPSYTIDTLRALQADGHAQIVLVLGSDAYADMPSWREYERVREACEVAVVTRPGAPEAAPAARTHLLAGPALQVSATLVRQRLQAGHSVRYLVPEPVADYIQKKGLYR